MKETNTLKEGILKLEINGQFTEHKYKEIGHQRANIFKGISETIEIVMDGRANDNKKIKVDGVGLTGLKVWLHIPYTYWSDVDKKEIQSTKLWKIKSLCFVEDKKTKEATDYLEITAQWDRDEDNRRYEKNKSLEQKKKDLEFSKFLENGKDYTRCGDCLFNTLTEREKLNYDDKNFTKLNRTVDKILKEIKQTRGRGKDREFFCFYCEKELPLDDDKGFKYSLQARVYICGACHDKQLLLAQWNLENYKLNHKSSKEWGNGDFNPTNLRKEIKDREKFIIQEEATKYAYYYEERLPLLEISPCGYCGRFNAKKIPLLKELPEITPDREPKRAICQDCYFTAPVENNIRKIKVLDTKLSTLSPYTV